MQRRNEFRIEIEPIRSVDISIIKPSIPTSEARISLYFLPQASRAVMADSERSAWFCLQVFHGAEKDVESVLENFDIEAWVPRTERYSYPSRGRMVESGGDPWLPEYVLVRCAWDRKAFRGLTSVVNVVKMVGGNLDPAPISDRTINEFKRSVATGDVKTMPVDTSLTAGDNVLVGVGPFAELYGKIVQVQKKRAKVGVSMFGRVHDVSIPLAYLKKL